MRIRFIPFNVWSIGVCLLVVACQAESQAEMLFSVSARDGLLRRIDPATGATIQSVQIVAAGLDVFDGTALATDPVTGRLWAILKTDPDDEDEDPRPRTLATIDPTTGRATVIGDTGDSFAGIAFDASGTLYGVSGDGAVQNETLFTLNKLNGTATLVTPLGNGADGEEIAFNPADGLLYHASGILSDPDVIRVFESVDLMTLAVTPIPLSGDPYVEITAMTFDSSGDILAASLFDNSFFRLTTGGESSPVGLMDHKAGGLAFAVPEPSSLALAILGLLGLAWYAWRRRCAA